MSEITISSNEDVAGVANLAGSSDWYFDNGKLICADVPQAVLNDSHSKYDAKLFAQQTFIAKCKIAIQAMLDAKANEYELDCIQNIGQYVGYENTRRDRCESLGLWSAACWDKGREILATATKIPTVKGVLAQMPVYVG